MYIHKFKALLVVALGIFALTSLIESAYSHHSHAMYNKTQVKVVTGVVVRVNPDSNHMQIYFAPLNAERTQVIRDGENKPVIWMVELGPAAQEAKANNVTVNGFPKGTIFSVALSPLANGQPGGFRWGDLGLFKCPPKTPPAPGLHCDSVKGTTAHGPGILPKQDGPLVVQENKSQ